MIITDSLPLVTGKSVCQCPNAHVLPLLILLHAGDKKADDKDEKEIKGM